MNNASKPPPRFVPTLTEVVDLTQLSRLNPGPKADVQALIALVQSQVQPLFERRLQEELDQLVRTLVVKQCSDFGNRLQEEMRLLISQAVIDALSAQSQEKFR